MVVRLPCIAVRVTVPAQGGPLRPIAFCVRCRGMGVGWNRKYLKHRLLCKGDLALYFRLPACILTAAFLVSLFPSTTSIVAPESTEVVTPTRRAVPVEPTAVSDPSVYAIEDVLGRHSGVDADARSRIARAVVTSARKHDVDPFLVASILVVESSGDPFAISGRDAVGIMQIHVPTWGSLVEDERINLFRLEDNIELGTRILKDYTRRHGLWDGVLRYLGATGPGETGPAYVRRVQGIYSDRLAD